MRWKIFRKFCRLDRTIIFFFAAGDERDGAPERGTGVGLEREMVCRRGLVSSVGLDWTPMPSIRFATGEKRDGALERRTGIGLEREESASGWRERWCTGEVWSPASGWAGL